MLSIRFLVPSLVILFLPPRVGGEYLHTFPIFPLSPYHTPPQLLASKCTSSCEQEDGAGWLLCTQGQLVKFLTAIIFNCSAQHLSPHLKLLLVCPELGGKPGELFWLCPCSSQGPTPIRIRSRRTLKQGGSRGRCESTKGMCSPIRCLEKTSGRSEDRGWTRAVPPLPHF
mgnify:CR=1 FL=1